jgi:hypothetical protein
MRYLKINDENLIVLDENKSEVTFNESEKGIILNIENVFEFLIPENKLNKFMIDINSDKIILDMNEYAK